MKDKYLKSQHALLVSKRNEIASKPPLFDKDKVLEDLEGERKKHAETLKALDARIGRLAAVFNPRISAKAEGWLNQEYGE